MGGRVGGLPPAIAQGSLALGKACHGNIAMESPRGEALRPPAKVHVREQCWEGLFSPNQPADAAGPADILIAPQVTPLLNSHPTNCETACLLCNTPYPLLLYTAMDNKERTRITADNPLFRGGSSGRGSWCDFQEDRF